MPVRRLLASASLLLLLALPAQAESLNEALVKAYNTNPDLAAAQATLRATDELAAQAMSNFRPRVDATASYAHSEQDGGSGATIDNTRALGTVAVTQPLFRGGRSLAEIRQADRTIEAQRALLHSTEQDVLLSSVQAYLDVVRDEAVLELNRNNEAVLTRQLRATRDRFEVGEVTRTDVSQAEARLSGARSGRVQAEGALAQSRAAYARVIGEKPGSLKKPEVDFTNLPASLDELLAMSEAGNPEFLSAQKTRDAAKAAVGVVKGERLPTVNLEASASRSLNSASSLDDRIDGSTVGVEMSWPLYAAGETSSRIRQAKQTEIRRAEEVESARRGVVDIATRAWEQLETARSVREARRSQVEAARVALDGVQQEAIVGSRTVLDTLDAEQELLDAQVSLVRAERDVILSQYQVFSAMGRLTARDLGLPVDYYDEKAYAQGVRWQPIGSSVKQ